MIIVEGCDGSGKSTLIKNLGITDTLWMGGARVKHPTRGVSWAYADNVPPVAQFGRQIQRNLHRVAFDRFHISERVYGPLLRGEQVMDDDAFERVSAELRRLRVPVILCLPPYEAAYANVTLAGRERPVYQTDAFLRRAYDEFLALQPWATVVYDFTRDPIPVLPS